VTGKRTAEISKGMKNRIFYNFLRQIGKMREPAKQGELENQG
jgi:hypothetical protein